MFKVFSTKLFVEALFGLR